MTVYSVKCLVRNHFTPDYEAYSSYDEVTLLVKRPPFHTPDTPVDKERWRRYLATFVEDAYENADGVDLHSKLFHITGVQEIEELLDLSSPVLEAYCDLYRFNRQVKEATFLDLYYFSDLK